MVPFKTCLKMQLLDQTSVVIWRIEGLSSMEPKLRVHTMPQHGQTLVKCAAPAVVRPRKAVIKSAASAASPEGFLLAVMKSAASTAPPTTKKIFKCV